MFFHLVNHPMTPEVYSLRGSEPQIVNHCDKSYVSRIITYSIIIRTLNISSGQVFKSKLR